MLATYAAWTTLVVTLSPSCSHRAYTASTCAIVIGGTSGAAFSEGLPEMLEPLIAARLRGARCPLDDGSPVRTSAGMNRGSGAGLAPLHPAAASWQWKQNPCWSGA